MKQQKAYPLMSIVLLNWNGLEDTKTCLEHLRKLEYPNYEIIVVDNGSRPDSKRYLEKVKDIIYVDNPVNRGFTGGHIDGLARASGEFIVLLNNDAVMQSDYLTKALAHFETDPTVAAVGGRSYFWNDEQKVLDQTNNFYAYQEVNVFTGEAFMKSSDFDVPQVVNNVSGSAVVVRRSVIDEVGYLYDRFFAYFEETDLFARFKRAGYKIVYDPALHIWHRNGASSGASSGSSFFYYRIFKNRFIFAMRNFETQFLWKFLRNYIKIAVGSFARYLLRPGSNKVMHGAYARAAFHNLLGLPASLASRMELRQQLGASRYNHVIYKEQTGISFVYDCTILDRSAITKLQKSLQSDTDPLHEYVLVVRGDNHSSYTSDFTAEHPTLRFVTDRQYFDVNPLNLGCLAARFDWICICTPEEQITSEGIADAVAHTLGTPAQLIAFGTPNLYADTLVIHRNLFAFMGGLPKEHMTAYLVAYAGQKKVLQWQPYEPVLVGQKIHKQSVKATKVKNSALAATIAFDETLAKKGKLSLIGKINQKYYRFYQVFMLFRWLFLRQISLYLKAARIKNLMLFTATLRRKQLALELRHIRNEVILNTTPGDVPRQNKIIKQQLKRQLAKPDLVVFIICRDRLDGLLELISWLEQHNLTKIVLIDNDSVYPPLVEYFRTTPYQVIRLYRNVGHTSPWALALTRALVPEDFYIVSDPDVIPTEECPPDAIKHFLTLHQQFPGYAKVGFGLRIDDLPDHYPLKDSVIEWESQFWKQTLAPEAYEAGVDTTFALYKPFTYTYQLHPSIRTGHPYVARHLPWYMDPTKITSEETHYRLRADANVNSWNADTVADRYAKEMQRSKKKKK